MTTHADAGSAVALAARLERLPVTRTMRVWFLLISLGVFWDTYLLYSIGSLSSEYLKDAGNATLATNIPAALFLGTFTGAIGLGRLADRIGRGAAFTVNLGVLIVGCLAAVVSPAGPLLLVAVFVAGIGTGAEIPLSVTYAQEIAPPSRRGWASSTTLCTGFIGGTAGGLAAYGLAKADLPWPALKVSLLIAAVGSAVAIVLRRRVPESPLWLARTGRDAAAEASLRRLEDAVRRDLRGRSLPAPEPVSTVDTIGARRTSTLDLFRRGYVRKTLSAWAIELFQGFGSYGFTTFVPAILYARGYELVHALGFTAIIQIAYPVGTYLSRFVTDRFPRKWGMAVFYVVNMLCGLGFFFADQVWLVVVFGFLTEMLIFISGPLLHTYEAEIYPPELRGRGAGSSFSVSRLGGFLAPLAAGAIIAVTGQGAAAPYLITAAAVSWFLCAGVAAFAAVSTVVTPRPETR